MADMPTVIARRSSTPGPLSRERLASELDKFAGCSVGEGFFGPGGIDQDGVPWIVFVARNPRVVQHARNLQAFTMMVWMWNITPSAMVTFTPAYAASPRSPSLRWARSGHGEILQRFRQLGRLRTCIAHSSGVSSGWFDGMLMSPYERNSHEPYFASLNRQLVEFPLPGIRHSRMGERFDPLNREETDGVSQIPLWPEPVSDCWKTLAGTGPWREDCDARDARIFAWAEAAYRARHWQASWIQMIKDRQLLDGASPLLDSQGAWLADSAARDSINRDLQEAPAVGTLLRAVAGPQPDAHAAYDAAFALLHEAPALHVFISMMNALGSTNDETFAHAVKHSLEAALLDWRITGHGTRRPWLKNLGHAISLETIALDLESAVDDFNTLWRSGLELLDLLDAGLWYGPHDFPIPPGAMCAAFESVRLEGTIEEARGKVQELLSEAQAARQWSVPWGARVQIQFGPFTALRIFEHFGEFTCLFLDEQERYYHVAIGLGRGVPRVAALPLMRLSPEDESEDGVEWNEDGEVSLELVAAAIVRDFLVVEERERLFATRNFRRRMYGRNISSIIYLPRVRYSVPSTNALADDVSSEHASRPRHSVTHHLRRAVHASAGQRFLAQRYGVEVPEGFTFVRPHARGTDVEEARIRTYRSRSASRMLFQELAEAPEGTRPAWFEFERDCARLLQARGMRVVHQAATRDGDGGVDLFAVDQQGGAWVVQCKCWSPSRPVGPDVVRELVGATAAAARGSDKPVRGMIITTSRLTSGAVSEALANQFTWLDAQALARELAQLPPGRG
jgi:Restriction endonuclease